MAREPLFLMTADGRIEVAQPKKRELWEVWKYGPHEWKVKFPKGVMTYRTKRAAERATQMFRV